MQHDKKGDFYVAVIEKPGRPAIEVIAEIVPEVVRDFPVAEVDALGRGVGEARRARLGAAAAFHRRDLRAGDRRARDRAVRGRRHRGRRHDARPPLPGARSRSRCGASTTMWRSSKRPRSCSIRSGASRSILADAKNLAFAQGFELVEDEGLLDEVAGLVEWPVVLMGSFDEAFLAIPPEVIRTTIRNNQKCFVLRDPQERQARQPLHPGRQHRGQGRRQGDRRRQRARDPRAAVRREILLRDRSEDASSKTGCRSSSSIVFHEKLGTQAERVERIERWRRELAPLVGADRRPRPKRAARLAKADLVTEMVGEFPELQGADGQLLRAGAGRGRSGRARDRGALQAARARSTACRPIRCRSRSRWPTSSTRWSGFWAIDEKPTGSKDPYALAARGAGRHPDRAGTTALSAIGDCALAAMNALADRLERKRSLDGGSTLQTSECAAKRRSLKPHRLESLRSSRFFADRLKVQLREQGARHDLVDAVFALDRPGRSAADRPPRRGARQIPRHRGRQEPARRLQARRQHPAHRGKEGRRDYVGKPDPCSTARTRNGRWRRRSTPPRRKPSAAVAREDFAAAMRAIAKLRPHVDAFFDKVTVNVDDADKPSCARTACKLLNEIREATRAVADFSQDRRLGTRVCRSCHSATAVASLCRCGASNCPPLRCRSELSRRIGRTS